MSGDVLTTLIKKTLIQVQEKLAQILDLSNIAQRLLILIAKAFNIMAKNKKEFSFSRLRKIKCIPYFIEVDGLSHFIFNRYF